MTTASFTSSETVKERDLQADRGLHLIIGVDGTLGASLHHCLSLQGSAVKGTSRRPDTPHLKLDLSKPWQEWELPQEIGTVYLMAGITSMARCAAEPELTDHINVAQIKRLVELLASRGAFIVFPSTNQVFDGSRPDVPVTTPPNPVSRYGQQKVQVEQAVLALGRQGAVIRYSKIISPGYALFEGWRQKLAAGEQIQAFEDMVMAPVTLAGATQVMSAVAEYRLAGLHQFSGNEDISYFRAAQTLALVWGADVGQVKAVLASTQLQNIGACPRHTTLQLSKSILEKMVSRPDPHVVLCH